MGHCGKKKPLMLATFMLSALVFFVCFPPFDAMVTGAKEAAFLLTPPPEEEERALAGVTAASERELVTTYGSTI